MQVNFHRQTIEMSSADNGRSYVGTGARGGVKVAIQNIDSPTYYTMLEGRWYRETGALRMVNGQLVEIR